MDISFDVNNGALSLKSIRQIRETQKTLASGGKVAQKVAAAERIAVGAAKLGARAVGISGKVLGKIATPLMVADGQFNNQVLTGNFLGAANDLKDAAVMLVDGFGHIIAHPIDSATGFYDFAKQGDNWSQLGSTLGETLGTGARVSTQTAHIAVRNAFGMESYDSNERKYLHQAVGVKKNPVIKHGQVQFENGDLKTENKFYRLALDGKTIHVYQYGAEGQEPGLDILEAQFTVDNSGQHIMSKTENMVLAKKGQELARTERTIHYDNKPLETLKSKYGADFSQKEKTVFQFLSPLPAALVHTTGKTENLPVQNPTIGQMKSIHQKTMFINPLAENFILSGNKQYLQITTPVMKTVNSTPHYHNGILWQTDNKTDIVYVKDVYPLTDEQSRTVEALMAACGKGEKSLLDTKQELSNFILQEGIEPLPQNSTQEVATTYTTDTYSPKKQALSHEKLFKNNALMNEYGIYLSKTENMTDNYVKYFNEDEEAAFIAYYKYNEAGENVFDSVEMCKEKITYDSTGKKYINGEETGEFLNQDFLQSGNQTIVWNYLEQSIPGYVAIKYNYNEQPVHWVQHSKQLSGGDHEAVLVHKSDENGVYVDKMLKIDKTSGMISEFNKEGRFARLITPQSADYTDAARLASIVTDVPNFQADERQKESMLAQNNIQPAQNPLTEILAASVQSAQDDFLTLNLYQNNQKQ